MSELNFDDSKRINHKVWSVISLDKQENNLNPGTKSPLYLWSTLVMFTCQLSTFVVPFTLYSKAGVFTNFLVVVTLVAISAYSMTSFVPDNKYIDDTNRALVRKELGKGWYKILRFSIFMQYLCYGQVLIYFGAEATSYIVFDKTNDLGLFLYCTGGIALIYVVVILTRLENLVFYISRFSTFVSIIFNAYVIFACLYDNIQNLDSISMEKKAIKFTYGEKICSQNYFLFTRSTADDFSIIVCYWIVICEVALFIMGFPAGSLKPRSFISVGLFNFIINIAMTVMLLPRISCEKFKDDGVRF